MSDQRGLLGDAPILGVNSGSDHFNHWWILCSLAFKFHAAQYRLGMLAASSCSYVVIIKWTCHVSNR